MADMRAAVLFDTGGEKEPPGKTPASAGPLAAGVRDALLSGGFTVRLRGFSAIDRYLGRDSLPFVFLETDAALSDLARLFEGLRFPGAALADAAVEQEGRDYFFHCLDRDSRDDRDFACKLLRFTQDWKTGRFYDPVGFYPFLRRLRDGEKAGEKTPVPPWWEGFDQAENRLQALMEGALILARYCSGDEDSPSSCPKSREIGELAAAAGKLPPAPSPGAEELRVLLTALLDSPRPALGLELLKASGFIGEFWPELAILDDVDHSKEFHPEGNVWRHTMETFRYRKPAAGSPAAYETRLSLALLLHDAGKPLAASSGNHRFEAHAELGAQQARRFLDRLGFSAALVRDVAWLVRNHMLPAALPRLPLSRTREIMESPLFPLLMELYRCDESSSFKGLDGYYESSAAYHAYLKHRRNPYRTAEGRKISRRELLNR
ncbi:MAG: HD domain-containing protein [Treponema sp.]|jgi:poly(A) polymerase|nr:HD domain-containing protein [Treponema sp.]